jgi:hypothetical protein
VIDAARLAGLDDAALNLWFDGMSASSIKARLHGWLMWTCFCSERGLLAEGMLELSNPSVTMANFAAFVEGSKISAKWKADSRPAAVVLFDLLLPGARTTDNAFLRTFFRSATVTIRRHSKYGDIWALGPVLDGVRSSTPVEKLDWKRQKARCAFILMVFVPLRMIAIWRLDPTTERPGSSDGIIEVMTRDKTDS